MTLDAGSVSLQPRGILVSGSFCTTNLKRENGRCVVSGWTICDTSADFCMTFRVFTLCKRLTIGQFLPWMCLVILCLVVIWAKLSFCARVRFVNSADPGLAMQGARLSWWVP